MTEGGHRRQPDQVSVTDVRVREVEEDVDPPCAIIDAPRRDGGGAAEATGLRVEPFDVTPLATEPELTRDEPERDRGDDGQDDEGEAPASGHLGTPLRSVRAHVTSP